MLEFGLFGKSNYIKNDFYAEIERIANEKGIEVPDTSWKIEIDVSGTITINGDITEENKEQIKNIISENFADDMWEDVYKRQHIFRMMVIPAKHGKLICRVPVMLLPENVWRQKMIVQT